MLFLSCGKKGREGAGEKKKETRHFKINLLSVTVNWCDSVLRGWSCECLQNIEREA